jgi:hypothetical protein
VTIHYHGTPITPLTEINSVAGEHFCVSHWRPDQDDLCHRIGQTVLLDNGAFSAWTAGTPITDWQPFLAWADRWLDYPTTWAIIPDVITGTDDEQDALIAQWPHGRRGAPVWHLHEPVSRLLRLADEWPRICMGSSAQYRKVMSSAWQRRMDDAWRELDRHHRRSPWVHMLRGMQTVGQRWPFASVDSTDIARNHNRRQNSALKLARRWAAVQCPPRFECPGEQLEIAA